MNKGILIVLSGFSGAGKGTLMKKLVSEHDNYALSVSMTTRAPREGERNGIEYYFVSQEEFENRIAQGKMIEYANYCGNYYGTPKDFVQEQLAAGKDVILEIEIQGAMQIKKMFPDCLLMFVTPPSGAELRRRLEGRGTETQEVIMKRLSRAVEESEGVEAYDYIVINDDLDACIAQINSIVYNERFRAHKMMGLIESIREELKEIVKGE